jgi:hypothetical protein
LSNGEQSSTTAQELLMFFETLRDDGPAPVYEAYIDKLEQEGVLGEEAADLLRRGNRHGIEQHLDAASEEGEFSRVFIFWPPGTG